MLKLTSISAAAAMCLLGAAAWGQQAGDAASAGLSRAEVRAELTRAQANGEIASWREASVDGTAPMFSIRAAGAQGRSFTAPGRSRAEIQAELASARASGEMARLLSLDVHGGY